MELFYVQHMVCVWEELDTCLVFCFITIQTKDRENENFKIVILTKKTIM